MSVKRIVANIQGNDLEKAKTFYNEILGLKELMNHGWIITYGSTQQMQVQISIASEGGSGTPVPDLSIEVDNLDAIYIAMKKAGFQIIYPLTEEPWGVRRFFVQDPFNQLVNILEHP
ncbi:VOC family protein [Pedobacter sp. AW31-3R]|uniref:VOC family protein n=1 Tax=Pedobacter sp. AW31-3R TaxID=3445781 RepID=UPI003FA1495B